MDPAPPTPRASRAGAAHARLRAATADLHAGLDALFGGDGLASPERYRRYLLGMHRFAADFELATGSAPRQSTWLADDLGQLSLAPLPAQDGPRPVADADARLGWRYVMAGSSLGARGLLHDARRLGHADGQGATFLARHAACGDWAALLAQLRTLDADDGPRMQRTERGARAAFARVRACFARSFERVLPPSATGPADDP